MLLCPDCQRPLTNHGPGVWVCTTCRWKRQKRHAHAADALPVDSRAEQHPPKSA